MAEKERAKTHFYAKPPTDTEEQVPFKGSDTSSGTQASQEQRKDSLSVQTPTGSAIPTLREGGPRFKSAARTNTQVVTTRIPTDLLRQVREFCEARHIIFYKFCRSGLGGRVTKATRSKEVKELQRIGIDITHLAIGLIWP